MPNASHSVLKTFLTVAVFALAASLSYAEPPPELITALRITPLHTVDYARPTAAEVKTCKVDKEVAGKVISWVVKNGDGQVLRRFSDTNQDLQVDVWCYFKDDLEVYRDIDSNYDRKADQHRWFNTGGAKWGVDDNQDEKIDRWKRITPHEVAEELVHAIIHKDKAAFDRLLLTTSELNSLGLDPSLRSRMIGQLSGAAPRFEALLQRQKTITSKSRCVDFGAPRPGALPSAPGAKGAEAIVYEGASALVETDGKNEQLQLGVLVQVGDAWRLVEAPQLGGDNVEISSLYTLSRNTQSTAENSAPPSDKMQKLMNDLQQLDARRATLAPSEQAKLIGQREAKLLALVEVTQEASIREQWYRQLADMYSSAAMEGYYKNGVKRLGELEAALAKRKVSKDLMAHVRYLRIWTDWVTQSQSPTEEFAKIQENWLKQLRAFVKAFPHTEDAAEGYLQLGMTLEFSGETEEALECYSTVAADFSGTARGEKGKGAVRRLNSTGKPISVRGPAIRGGTINLSRYRGKHVLVQYWASWYGPSKEDMNLINQSLAKYKAKGFDVLGVNLDTSLTNAKGFLAKNRYPWTHVYDTAGLEGRLANEMGVMTLPLMMLVDDQGKVVNRNLHASQLDAELKRLLK